VIGSEPTIPDDSETMPVAARGNEHEDSHRR
jgi:hypothetical protein